MIRSEPGTLEHMLDAIDDATQECPELVSYRVIHPPPGTRHVRVLLRFSIPRMCAAVARLRNPWRAKRLADRVVAQLKPAYCTHEVAARYTPRWS